MVDVNSNVVAMNRMRCLVMILGLKDEPGQASLLIDAMRSCEKRVGQHANGDEKKDEKPFDEMIEAKPSRPRKPIGSEERPDQPEDGENECGPDNLHADVEKETQHPVRVVIRMVDGEIDEQAPTSRRHEEQRKECTKAAVEDAASKESHWRAGDSFTLMNKKLASVWIYCNDETTNGCLNDITAELYGVTAQARNLRGEIAYLERDQRASNRSGMSRVRLRDGKRAITKSIFDPVVRHRYA